MKGWRIFLHSVRLVLRNIDQALRVSAVLYLVQVAGQVQALVSPAGGGGPGDPMAMADPQAAFLRMLFGIAAVVASLWIAVAWHRFVLEEEYPAGFVPRWQGTRLLAYLLRSVVVGIFVVLGLLGGGLVVIFVSTLVPQAGALLSFGLIGLGGYLFFRLGVALPAAAVGQSMTLRDAWGATRDPDGAILVLAFLVIAGSLLLQAPSLLNTDPGSVVNLVYTVVTGWFATMIGISILTTLYGHYVQGRSID